MRIRFGVIGCGKVAERVALPQLTRCRLTQVTALVDRNRRAAERLADRFEISPRLVWSDWTRMLREAEVDAVAVCLPNHLHAQATLAALQAKKHVMVEKPIASRLEDAEAMVAAARRHRRYLMVEQTQRFDPVHEVAHGLLRRRVIGALLQICGRIGHAGPEYWAGGKPGWFVDPRRSGGGALMDVGAHMVDLLQWLSGQRIRRVFGQGSRLRKPWPVEDNGSVLVEFAGGAIGAVEASWTTRPYEVATVFYGERGTLRTTVGASRTVEVLLGREDGAVRKIEHPAVPARSRWGGAYPYFARCIRQGIEPEASGAAGCRTLEVILAAYASMRTGGWVTLPLR